MDAMPNAMTAMNILNSLRCILFILVFLVQNESKGSDNPPILQLYSKKLR